MRISYLTLAYLHSLMHFAAVLISWIHLVLENTIKRKLYTLHCTNGCEFRLKSLRHLIFAVNFDFFKMRISNPLCLLFAFALNSWALVGCDNSWHDERCTMPGTNAIIYKCTDCNWRAGNWLEILSLHIWIAL